MQWLAPPPPDNTFFDGKFSLVPAVLCLQVQHTIFPGTVSLYLNIILHPGHMHMLKVNSVQHMPIFLSHIKLQLQD